ncbi:MAG: hypothetical protein R2748_10195 [Bryobacterales bacterium]
MQFRRQPIAAFEAAEALGGDLPLVLVPLFVLLMTPFIRPFRWSRLFWTYVIPVLPLAIFWDGVVSYLRAYTRKSCSKWLLVRVSLDGGTKPSRPSSRGDDVSDRTAQITPPPVGRGGPHRGVTLALRRSTNSPNKTKLYALPVAFLEDAATEIVIPKVLPEDERIWVPQADQVWFRPLCLSTGHGYWVNLLKVRGRHPGSSPAPPARSWLLIKGKWRYLEHDWTAEEGGYVYTNRGETHTPTCLKASRR